MKNGDQINQLTIEDIQFDPVDQHSPVPLYHQIYLDLRRMIEDQEIPPGSILPPETEICQSYNVGRQTIRKAIARLVDDNLVHRHAGRGTFVHDHTQRSSFQLDRSYSHQMRDLGHKPSSQLICQEESILDAGAPAILQKLRGSNCLNIERIRYADGTPICYQSSTVLTQRCPDLAKYDFGTESLYEVLAKEYNLILIRLDHNIRAVEADEYRAELLQIQQGLPLLFVDTTAYLEDGEIIENSVSYYRAERYEFRTTDLRM